MHGPAFKSIKLSTRAIAFFGTPHRGGNLADLGSVLASVALCLTGGVKNNFMETLQKNSTAAADIQELFKEQAQEYRIVSFYETLPFKGLGLVSYLSLQNWIRTLTVYTDCGQVFGNPGSTRLC